MRGVEAYLPEDDDWRVVVAVAEFIREEPLESELVTGVETALRSGVGVTNVWHEDREQWWLRVSRRAASSLGQLPLSLIPLLSAPGLRFLSSQPVHVTDPGRGTWYCLGTAVHQLVGS